MRVTAQLIDAATGAHVWSERYDRPAGRPLRGAGRGGRAGSSATLTGYSGPLAKAGAEAARRKPPESLRAYDYYLLAKAPYIRHDAAGMVEARRLLEKAIALDPDLIRAWDTARLDALPRRPRRAGATTRQRSWAGVPRRAARKAAELDPMDGGAHVVAGMSHFVKGEVEQGAAAWDRALALSPNDANVLRPIGAQLALALGASSAPRRGWSWSSGPCASIRSIRPTSPSALGFACYFAG